MMQLLREWSPVLVAALMILLRKAKRYWFWSGVVAVARRIVNDADNPITDPREAAERALLDAQSAQIDAIQRSIERGGNGFRNGR